MTVQELVGDSQGQGWELQFPSVPRREEGLLEEAVAGGLCDRELEEEPVEGGLEVWSPVLWTWLPRELFSGQLLVSLPGRGGRPTANSSLWACPRFLTLYFPG